MGFLPLKFTGPDSSMRTGLQTCPVRAQSPDPDEVSSQSNGSGETVSKLKEFA